MLNWVSKILNYKCINQLKNDTCHVQSLENDFYLGTLVPLTVFSPFIVKKIAYQGLWGPM